MRFDFYDWGSWGIGDFYDGIEAELKATIESGGDFDSDWHGFKKELQSMRIFRKNGILTVQVSEYMDEAVGGEELFYDFLTDDELELLTDDLLERIRDVLYDCDFAEDTKDTAVLPTDATLEDVVKKATELMNGCSNKLHESFLDCIAATLNLMYENDPKMEEITRKRLEEYR